MQKQLNPDLFGTEAQMTFTNTDKSPVNQASFDHILNLDSKIAELRQQVAALKEGLAQVRSESQLQQKSVVNHLEQFTRSIKILEQNDQTLAQQNQQKNQHLSQKLADYKNIELKLKEMMDRHQMVLKSYELKIQQLQNVIVQKEGVILGFQSALQDARAEIARLKRA